MQFGPRWFFSGLIVAAAAASLLAPARAEDAALQWRHGISTVGELKYQPGFAHFDYINPKAPKGGALKLSNDGTFDTFNPLLAKGETAVGVGLVFDTLMKSSEDEVTTSYGLLAEGVSYPDDISSATYRLRGEAKWA
ncbi:MAG TPA: ABC transporter substrate-binding protein, partial [Mycoplana sp.]|nr:ABC transporter substrate-binding protein [Mycoplana sp.]